MSYHSKEQQQQPPPYNLSSSMKSDTTLKTRRRGHSTTSRTFQQQQQQHSSNVQLPRLVQRDLPYHQSRNRISVTNEKHFSKVWPLLIRDWFHVLLRMPTVGSVTMLLTTWTTMVLIFAGIYVALDEKNKDLDCGLGPPGIPIAWGTSFAFSLETCTTVGYGLPGSTNAFFESNCPSIQVAIYAQMTWSMMFNAFLFAFFYSVLSKCEYRSMQLIFADKLCIKVRDNGKICVSSRCYDIDSMYPVVESHARMYVMDRKMQMHVLRLDNPNDDMGGMLYASLPAEVTHVVDHHSALSPRPMPLVMSDQGMCLRTVDAATGNRDEVLCPVCGEAYGTYERLLKHLRYARISEEQDNYPMEDTHRGFIMPDITPISLDEVKNHMENFISEIVVVVEGIDPQVSGTFQSLQSYKLEDIVWEGSYEPCVSIKDNKFSVDLGMFHSVRVPAYCKVIEDFDIEGGVVHTKLSSDSSERETVVDMAMSIEAKSSEDSEAGPIGAADSVESA